MRVGERHVLLTLAEGIGNQVEAVPAFCACRRVHGRVSVWNASGSCPDATRFLFARDAVSLHFPDDPPDPSAFDAQVRLMLSHGFRLWRMKDLTRPVEHLMGSLSEVEVNLLCVAEEWDLLDIQDACGMFGWVDAASGVPDVLLHDGYSKRTANSEHRWRAKSWPYYVELACALDGQGVEAGSIGAPAELVPGTRDLTGTSLETTASLLRGTKLLVCNDTGTYHLACLLGVPCLALFTFTNPVKNFDERFHRTATVLRRRDLECSPCQEWNGRDLWTERRDSCKWACRLVSVERVLRTVLELLGMDDERVDTDVSAV